MNDKSIMFDEMIKHFNDGKIIALHYPDDDNTIVNYNNRGYNKIVKNEPFVGFYKEDGSKQFINTRYVKEIRLT